MNSIFLWVYTDTKCLVFEAHNAGGRGGADTVMIVNLFIFDILSQ